jgi:Gpi18-like mannosyltransferase
MSNLRKSSRHAEVVLVAALLALALLARWAGGREITGDMKIFFQWYNQLKAHGIGTEIGNYNAPFLYLFAILTYLPGATILKIKLVWFCFDVILVLFTYRLVALRRPGRRIPALAALVMAFLPTVVINSSYYGQCDAIWAGLAVGGLWLLLSGRDWWGVGLFTVALAFKPQAIFIFPLLLLLVLAGRVRWRTLLVIPVLYVLLDVPAFIAGRDPLELLTLYNPARQSGHVPLLTQNAPSVYAFLPVTGDIGTVRTLGDLFTAIVVLGVIYTLIAGRVELDNERIVTAAAFFALVVPFLLPGMHERYFYLADVLTLVLAFYRPRLWPVALLVEASSLLSYLHYLLLGIPHGALVPPAVCAAMMLAAALTIGYTLLHDLRPVSQPAELPEPLPTRRV